MFFAADLPPQAPTVQVRIAERQRQLLWSSRPPAIQVVVRVTGAEPGSTLEYTATAPGYRGAALEREVRPVKGSGKHVFLTRPQLTSEYSVVLKDANEVGAAVSAPKRIEVSPLIKLRSTTSGALRLAAVVSGPRRVAGVRVRSGSGRRAFFYAQAAGALVYRRIAKAPLGPCERPGCSRLASHVVRDEQLLFESKSFRICVPGEPIAGMDVTGPCPDEIDIDEDDY